MTTTDITDVSAPHRFRDPGMSDQGPDVPRATESPPE